MLQKGEPKILTAFSLAAVVLVLAGLAVAVVHFHMPVKETYWALTPPVIAIALALITKEVYSSLFLGILTGAFLNAGFDLVGTLNQVFTGGLIKVLADKWNVGILIFLIVLGMMVQLMNRAGGPPLLAAGHRVISRPAWGRSSRRSFWAALSSSTITSTA